VSLLKHTPSNTDIMFQNPYQRCQYELVTHRDGKVWLGSFRGEAERHYVSCIGNPSSEEFLKLHGPALRYYWFEISLHGKGYTPAVAQEIDDFFKAHGMVVYTHAK
jgi:hypothetical protein